MNLRVLTYNIHKGRAFFSRRKKWSALLKFLEEIKPDLIFLQEFLVEKETEKFLEVLADNLWPHHALGHNAIAAGGYHYGNAILSKHPLKQTKNFDITASAWEKRGILYGKIAPQAGQELHLFCCHLNLTQAGRIAQLQKMQKVISTLTSPKDSLLLAGDFNDWSESLHPAVIQSLHVQEAFETLTGRLAASAPSVFPLFSLDRVYYRKLLPRAGAKIQNLPWGLGSDHVPLLVDFTCSKEKK